MRRTALLAVVAALALAAPAHGASTVTMSGSVVTGALIADLVYFYRHDVRDPPQFSLTGGVTATGIADAAHGIVDGGMVARALVPGDPPGLVLTRIARGGLCLVTNRANPVRGITRAQIQDIVAGRVTTWGRFRGRRARIRSSRSSSPRRPEPRRGSSPSSSIPRRRPSTGRSLCRPTSRSATSSRRPRRRSAMPTSRSPARCTCSPSTAWAAPGRRSGPARIPAPGPLGVVSRGRPRGALARFLRWTRTSRVARRLISTRYLAG